MIVKTEMEFHNQKKPQPGVYLMSDGRGLRYRIWIRQKWYPVYFHTEAPAINEFNYLKNLYRDRLLGALAITGVLLVVVFSLFLLARIVK